MKHRAFSMIMLVALAMALGSALVVSQVASAQCVDTSTKESVPCPNDKKKKTPPTDVPTRTPSPAPATQAPVAVQSIVVATPNASQLAALCANLPAGASSTGGANPGNPSPNGPPTPPSSSGFGLGSFELGGGGLLLGVLIGLLLPAVQRSVNGDGRGLIGLLRGGIVGPDRAGYNGDGNFNGDGRSQLSAKIFAKIDGGGFDKQGEAGLNYSKQGNAGMDDWERGGSVGAQGEAAAAVDMFHKADSASAAGGNTWSQKGEASLNYSKQGDAGFQDLHQKAGGGSFDKDAKAGYLKQDGTSMGDGSVHNMDSQFQKGSDAGITDGSSFTGNG